MIILPFQQVVNGLEQEGPALVGQSTLPKPFLSHWKTQDKQCEKSMGMHLNQCTSSWMAIKTCADERIYTSCPKWGWCSHVFTCTFVYRGCSCHIGCGDIPVKPPMQLSAPVRQRVRVCRYVYRLTHTPACAGFHVHTLLLAGCFFFFFVLNWSDRRQMLQDELLLRLWGTSKCVKHVANNSPASWFLIAPYYSATFLHNYPGTNPPNAFLLNKKETMTKIYKTSSLQCFFFVLCHIPARLQQGLGDRGWVLCLLIGWRQTNWASQEYTR